jgi:thiol-disulfide isomerase/thioredoxin
MKPADAPGLMTQKTAPDFTATTLDKKTVHLSDYKGKVVLVNFWATWCGPCRMEIPDLIKLQEELGPKGFTVLGLSNDDTEDVVVAFNKEAKFNYPILMATPEIRAAFGDPPGLPASFLINKEGKVVWEQQGVNTQVSMYSILKEEIEKRL